MAQRDLSNFRTVTQQVAKEPNRLLEAGVELAEGIIRQGQEAKMAEAVSQAQLDLSDLQSQYQIDFQGDPTKGAVKYKVDRQKIFDTIGGEISPLYKRQWQDATREMSVRNDATQQAWALKQTRVNTVAHVNNTMKNSFNQAGNDGRSFGKSDDAEIDAFINFETSLKNLQSFGNENLGEVTTSGMLETYQEDYMKSFIMGVSQTNPLKAAQLLDSEQVKNSFSDQKQWSDVKSAVENRALNFQKISVEQEALGALKQSATILNRPIDKPFTQLEIMELSKNVSEPTKAYLERIGGFEKSDSGSKLSNSEKFAEETALTEEVFTLAGRDDVDGKKLSEVQDKIMTALNNKSISNSDALFLTNEMMIPYTNKVEENLSQFNFEKNSLFGEDVNVGFNQLQDYTSQFLIGADDKGEIDIEELDEEDINFNNNQKMKMYRNYASALKSEARLRNISVADIMTQAPDEKAIILNLATKRAKTNYLMGRYPELVNMADNMPDKFIESDGTTIKTGLGNGKPTVSVNAPQNRTKFEDADGNFAWVYEDGRVEEIK